MMNALKVVLAIDVNCAAFLWLLWCSYLSLRFYILLSEIRLQTNIRSMNGGHFSISVVKEISDKVTPGFQNSINFAFSHLRFLLMDNHCGICESSHATWGELLCDLKSPKEAIFISLNFKSIHKGIFPLARFANVLKN